MTTDGHPPSKEYLVECGLSKRACHTHEDALDAIDEFLSEGDLAPGEKRTIDVEVVQVKR